MPFPLRSPGRTFWKVVMFGHRIQIKYLCLRSFDASLSWHVSCTALYWMLCTLLLCTHQISMPPIHLKPLFSITWIMHSFSFMGKNCIGEKHILKSLAFGLLGALTKHNPAFLLLTKRQRQAMVSWASFIYTSYINQGLKRHAILRLKSAWSLNMLFLILRQPGIIWSEGKTSYL